MTDARRLSAREPSPAPASVSPPAAAGPDLGPAGPAPEAAAPDPAPAGGRRGRRGYFLPGAIALVALLVIGGAVGAGDLSHPAPRTLNGPDVASQIALGVQSEQNDQAPPRVDCPPTEPVRAGLRFDCVLVPASGGPVTVAVTEVDGRGRLHWSLGARPPRT